MDEAAPQAARGGDGPETAAAVNPADLLGGVTLEMLRATFDGWTAAETGGRFWAVRSGSFTAVGPESLIRGCVMAGTAVGLADQLCLQAWLESLPAAELAAVWRDGTAATAL